MTFSYCVVVSILFSEELVSAFSTVKSGMLFVLGVSEPFKSFWGAMEESDVESLFELAKYELLINNWLVP